MWNERIYTVPQMIGLILVSSFCGSALVDLLKWCATPRHHSTVVATEKNNSQHMNCWDINTKRKGY